MHLPVRSKLDEMTLSGTESSYSDNVAGTQVVPTMNLTCHTAEPNPQQLFKADQRTEANASLMCFCADRQE